MTSEKVNRPICLGGGSSGRTAPRLMGRTA